MLVRIQKNWDFPDFMRQTPQSKGVWNNIQFTTDRVDNCDLLIVLNSPHIPVNANFPDGNAWLFSQESPIEGYRWHTNSFKYFDKVFTFWDKSISPNIIHMQTALPWHIDKCYDDLVKQKFDDCIHLKLDAVSWVTSDASNKEGHKLRIGLKDYLLEQQFSFDLFGKGFNYIPDKFDGIFPYKYSIAIENYSCNDYWTEKIADCFLSWTIPVYWGAKNILSYFPANSMLLIDPNNKELSLKTIRNAIDNDYYNKNLQALSEARELVLNKYQLFPHVCSLISEYSIHEGMKKKKQYIPVNPHYKKSFHFPTFIIASIKKLIKIFI
jgi:hypothetical protein